MHLHYHVGRLLGSMTDVQRRRCIMAVGWAQDGAVDAQIQDSINDEIARVRSRLAQGESLRECENCGELIPQARRLAVPGVRLCLQCQQEEDRQQRVVTPYNRRFSKASQLR